MFRSQSKVSKCIYLMNSALQVIHHPHDVVPIWALVDKAHLLARFIHGVFLVEQAGVVNGPQNTVGPINFSILLDEILITEPEDSWVVR